MRTLAHPRHHHHRHHHHHHQDANVLCGKSDEGGRQDGEEGEDQATAQRRHPEDIFSVKET